MMKRLQNRFLENYNILITSRYPTICRSVFHQKDIFKDTALPHIMLQCHLSYHIWIRKM